MKLFTDLFRRVPAAEILAQQLFEAQRLHAEHLAAAEMHMALAGVYGARIVRIQKTQGQPAVTTLRAAR